MNGFWKVLSGVVAASAFGVAESAWSLWNGTGSPLDWRIVVWGTAAFVFAGPMLAVEVQRALAERRSETNRRDA